MGNCFTKTYEIFITSAKMRRPASTAERSKATATWRRPSLPRHKAPPHQLTGRLPGSSSASGRASGSGEMGPVLQRPMVNVWSLYQLERNLGSGAFGTTYLCTEHATGLRYACKSVPKKKLVRRTDVEDLRREISILQHLSGQPNIVEFRSAYEDNDHVHLVMEYCFGGELFDRITAKGSYSVRQAATVFRDILTVVHVCHFMGVIHRDLKPENFLLANAADDAPLKAIDFGLSAFIEEGQDDRT
uniref:non-specific serine/threonine protein kinase n=1 Tax=Oryza punctata TaxID=4537 RepID=A0A0E0KTV3_ORYPU